MCGLETHRVEIFGIELIHHASIAMEALERAHRRWEGDVQAAEVLEHRRATHFGRVVDKAVQGAPGNRADLLRCTLRRGVERG